MMMMISCIAGFGSKGGGGNATPATVTPPTLLPYKVKSEPPLCFKADESVNERSELALDFTLLFQNGRSRKQFAFSYEKAIGSYYAMRGGLDISG
jgi:hypothetical protein